MKVIRILCLTVILVQGCETNQELQNRMDKADQIRIPDEYGVDRTETTILENYSPNSCTNLLLQVSTESLGMAYPRGKMLDIRILETGKAEYDRVDGASNGFERMEFSLSDAQLKEMHGLVNSLGRLGGEATYVGEEKCIDSVESKQLLFCPSENATREIVIETCGSTNIKKHEPIPSEIEAIMVRVAELTHSN